MAIKIDTVTPHGFKADAAYCRVEDVTVNKTQGYCVLRFYKDAGTQVSFKEQGIAFIYDMEGENPIKQAYEHIKKMPEFLGAMDC